MSFKTEFENLSSRAQRRMIAMAHATVSDDITFAQHHLFVTGLEVEARLDEGELGDPLPGSELEREFKFAQQYMHSVKTIRWLSKKPLEKPLLDYVAETCQLAATCCGLR